MGMLIFFSSSLLATVNKNWIYDSENYFLKYYSLDLTNFDSQWATHQTNIKKCAGM